MAPCRCLARLGPLHHRCFLARLSAILRGRQLAMGRDPSAPPGIASALFEPRAFQTNRHVPTHPSIPRSGGAVGAIAGNHTPPSLTFGGGGVESVQPPSATTAAEVAGGKEAVSRPSREVGTCTHLECRSTSGQPCFLDRDSGTRPDICQHLKVKFRAGNQRH
ncbi:UNVERIFIED_CONTAM: hypothetical protein K2H54_013310 [Gekko kuhli]